MSRCFSRCETELSGRVVNLASSGTSGGIRRCVEPTFAKRSSLNYSRPRFELADESLCHMRWLGCPEARCKRIFLSS